MLYLLEYCENLFEEELLFQSLVGWVMPFLCLDKGPPNTMDEWMDGRTDCGRLNLAEDIYTMYIGISRCIHCSPIA